MTKELSDKQIEQGWEQTFSTGNPFCPCDLKSFTKAVRWAERNLAAPASRKWIILLRRSGLKETMTFIDPNRVEYTISEKELADTPETVRTALRQMALQLSELS